MRSTHTVSYYRFNFCKVGGDVLSFIPDFRNLSLLLLVFLLHLTKGLSALLIFLENQLSTSLISALFFIMPFFVFVLGLVCSFPSSSLRWEARLWIREISSSPIQAFSSLMSL